MLRGPHHLSRRSAGQPIIHQARLHSTAHTVRRAPKPLLNFVKGDHAPPCPISNINLGTVTFLDVIASATHPHSLFLFLPKEILDLSREGGLWKLHEVSNALNTQVVPITYGLDFEQFLNKTKNLQLPCPFYNLPESALAELENSKFPGTWINGKYQPFTSTVVTAGQYIVCVKHYSALGELNPSCDFVVDLALGHLKNAMSGREFRPTI